MQGTNTGMPIGRCEKKWIRMEIPNLLSNTESRFFHDRMVPIVMITASAAASASAAATAPATSADGKQLATGTVVNTTFADRAAEVGYAGSDFAGDKGLLTLLVLDTPIQVTAHKGGSDYTGAVSVICLPNDEMFRQFKDKQITIGVDTWGEFPADVTGMLYDIVLDYQADGLTLVDPQS